MRPDALKYVSGWDLKVKAAHFDGGSHGSSASAF
jgi:hypothetical protein